MKPHLRPMGRKILGAALLIILSVASWPTAAFGYSEFQKYVKETSGSNVDCALCHAHPDGPDGMKPGQIGSLNPAELEALNRARTAFEPGQEIDSPILNTFGDSLIKTLGKKRVLALREDPAGLVAALRQAAPASDLDHDGILDADEYADGTHPASNQSGRPWKLFLVGVQQNAIHLVLLVLATVLGVFGLGHLLHWFELETKGAPRKRE